MIRPSPNEFERLRNEEFIKRRILRLKEVREYSKVNASRLRHLYKEQKIKVINKIAENIQEHINIEDDKKLQDLKQKYERQCGALGDAHNNASDWVDPAIDLQKKAETNHVIAQDRHANAINQLRNEKEDKEFVKNSRLDAINLAMLIEKERAAAIASLPPPVNPFYSESVLRNMQDVTPRVRVCDRNKYSVIESYETCAYNVERVSDEGNTFNAMEAGEMHQEHLLRLDANLMMDGEEQAIKAKLRGHQAIKKQIVQKDYSELITNLEQISKGEMAKRQRDYYKNDFVGPNSAGYIGMGHMAAMMGYKERCKERAVESAVMESLKDITNNSSSQQCHIVDESTPRETKLSKLYDIIRKQKENVVSEIKVVEQRVEERVESPDIRQEIIVADIVEKDDRPRETIRNAIAAASKTSSLLEKSTCTKQRVEIEKKIQHIDMRLEKIREDNDASDSRSSSRTVCSSQQHVDVFSRSGRSMEMTTESLCSDSLDIIREFQRQALQKLSGHSSVNQSMTPLCTLERQLSDLSLVSTSVSTEQSWMNNSHHPMSIVDGKPSEVPLSSSQSSVSEWVKSQLAHNIDQIPDWVTNTGKGEDQFMPDLNMSFMSSILNIRSETSSSRDDIHSSCSTVLTHSSVVRRTRQSSITEVSNIGSTTGPSRGDGAILCDDSFVSDLSATVMDKSFQSIKFNEPALLRTLSNEHLIDRREDDCEEDEHMVDDTKLGDILPPVDNLADLIDFTSVEDLSVTRQEAESDEEKSYQRALSELINIASSSTPNQDMNIDDKPREELSSRNGTEDCSIHQSNEMLSELSTFTQDIDIDSHLISDYQHFLAGLIDKPIHSHPPRIDLIAEEPKVPTIDPLISGRGDIVLSTPPDQEQSYLTSTIKDDHLIRVMSSSCSSIHARSADNGPPHLHNIPATVLSSQSSLTMDQLSTYSSEISDTVVSNQGMKILVSTSSEDIVTGSDEHHEKNEEQLIFNRKKIKNLLSSTMKPNRRNIEVMSPDVSSISGLSVEACNQLKQRVMQEYFEKNKNLIQAALMSSVNTSDLTMKPLESFDDSSPRHPDSGKPSSRLTIENSELDTARLTNEDFFMTPRTDNNWTEYTPRDEWSGSHNFRTLPEYESNECADDYGDVDLDETLKDNGACGQHKSGSVGSVNLINFSSVADLSIDDVEINPDQMGRVNPPAESRPYHDDSVPSEPSASVSATPSFKALQSYHSSPQTPSAHESLEPASDPDTSSVSLASFLQHESVCQQLEVAPVTTSPGPVDSGEDMRRQLAQWKKERLTRVNQHVSAPSMLTPIGRKKEEVEQRSRTLKLYNNLEEVQKSRQMKEAEQRKAENQLKKKEYAEKLRRLKSQRKEHNPKN